MATTTTKAITHPQGGTAVIASATEPETLNSFLPGGHLAVNRLIGQTYAAGVQDVDGNTLELVPDLVTELPTVENGGVVVNEDGTMTVTYTIRDDAVWEDGIPVSGDDFQFTYETIMDPDLPISKQYYDEILETVVGRKTFEYTMAVPRVQFELMFSEIIPKHDVEGTDFLLDWNSVRWVSAGPYVFDSWTGGESLTVTRNPNYWKTDPETDQQLPYLDEVTFRFITDPGEALDAFADEEADIIAPEATPEVVDRLESLEPDGVTVEIASGPVWEHFSFQFGPGRLDRNPNSCNDVYEMRLAIAQAIDRSVLSHEVLAGNPDPLESHVAAYAPLLSQDLWAGVENDPALAAENYAKAVEIAGKECSVVFSTATPDDGSDVRVRTSELLAGMFEAAGIPFDVQLEDRQAFFGATLADGTWDFGEWAWQAAPGFSSLVVIHDVFDPEGQPPKGSNYYRWGTEDSSVIDDSTERFAEIRDEMNATVDERVLKELIAEAETILYDNMVYIPLYSRVEAAGVWSDKIARFKHNPTSAGFTWNVEDWYRADLEG